MTIDEFKTVELRVAKILEATRVEGSDKLLKLKVSLGSEERQLLAGIGKAYAPENLVGTEIVMVANLDPRMMLGLESRGMLLAAHGEDGAPILLRPDKETPLGSVIS